MQAADYVENGTRLFQSDPIAGGGGGGYRVFAFIGRAFENDQPTAAPSYRRSNPLLDADSSGQRTRFVINSRNPSRAARLPLPSSGSSNRDRLRHAK